MQKPWNSVSELATEMAYRALNGRRVVLSPKTALLLAQHIQGARPPLRDRHNVDLYASRSCVTEVDAGGDVVEIAAWARNSIVARAAFDELCRLNPETSFQQRHRSWVEAERMVKP